jgi:hypothetical protein
MVHHENRMLHHDLRQRALIPLVAGALIMAALAIIWRWIS